MRELFFKLFSDEPTGCGVTISSFSVWHILYVILIIGGAIWLAFWLNKKDETFKTKALRLLAYALVISYISDFFVHDFVYADFENGQYVGNELNMDKLPFHICTVLCPIIAFTQFNKKFEKFLEPVAALAIVAPMMYITYPSTGVGGEPWCYRTVQTMFFHGVEFCWGFLTVATGKTALKWKNIWKPLALIGVITVWAKLGCTLLEYNWFFLRYDPFGLDLPEWSLIFLVPVAIFAMVSIIYAINYGVKHILEKRNAFTPALLAEVAPTDAEEK